MAREAAKLIIESSYKTAVATPTLNTEALVLHLPEADQVQVQRTPNRDQLRTPLSLNDPDRVVGQTSSISGSIRTLVYPSQAQLLLGWALQKVADQGTAGSEKPWVTSEPDGDLASMTLRRWIEDADFNVKKPEFTGGKVNRLRLTSDRNTLQGALVAELDVTFSEENTHTEAEPANSDYPGQTEAPYYLNDSSGNLSVNGVTISNYNNLSVEAENGVEARFDESTTVSRMRLHGRRITGGVTGLLKLTPDWEALFTGQSVFAASLAFDDGTNSVTLDWQSASRANDWSRNLPLDQSHEQTLSWLGQFDRSSSKSFAVTFA